MRKVSAQTREPLLFASKRFGLARTPKRGIARVKNLACKASGRAGGRLKSPLQIARHSRLKSLVAAWQGYRQVVELGGFDLLEVGGDLA